MEKLDVNKDYTLLADKQRYVNHTYLKKFDAFGFAIFSLFNARLIRIIMLWIIMLINLALNRLNIANPKA